MSVERITRRAQINEKEDEKIDDKRFKNRGI